MTTPTNDDIVAAIEVLREEADTVVVAGVGQSEEAKRAFKEAADSYENVATFLEGFLPLGEGEQEQA